MTLPADTYFRSVRSLGDDLRKRQITSVTLTEGYLERCRTIGAKLNAYVTLTPELALQQARQADDEIKAGNYRGPLHGVPYAVKDLVAVKGYPTTWGAVPYKSQSFDFNATVIERPNSATDFLHVQRVRPMLQRLANNLFDRYTVLISAAQPTSAQLLFARDPEHPKVRQFHLDRRAPDGISSLCGLPAISVPCGFSLKRLPFGMQIMGRALTKAAVLRAARLYQSRTEWHQQHPDL